MSNLTISVTELSEVRLSGTKDETLLSLSQLQPVMLVFLRHFGCIFCREALRDIAKRKLEIERKGNAIVLVHMEDDEMAAEYFKKYQIGPCLHVSDPECVLYQRFGLVKGSFSQLFGLTTMARGFSAGISLKQFGGAPFGDAFQMPGIFIIYKGQIVDEFIHGRVSDRPDYFALLDSCALD